MTWPTHQVREWSRSTGTTRLVLLTLATYMDKDGAAFPGVDTLATACSLGKRAVYDALAELVEAGELTREGKGGRGKRTVYRLADLEQMHGDPLMPRARRVAPPAGARPLVNSAQPRTDTGAETVRDPAPLPVATVQGGALFEAETVHETVHETVRHGALPRAQASQVVEVEEEGKNTDPNPRPAAAGTRETGMDFTSRSEALKAPCPHCQTKPGEPCRRANGDERVQFHAARHQAAIAAGAPVLTPEQRAHKPGPRGPGRPGPRDQGTNPRATGANPRTQRLVAGLRDASPAVAARWHDQGHKQLRSAVGDSTWQLWLSELTIAAVDAQGRAVLVAHPQKHEYAASRYGPVVLAAAAAAGVQARMATPEEVKALGVARAA